MTYSAVYEQTERERAKAYLAREQERAGKIAVERLPLEHPDPIAWIEEYFWIPETRGPLILDAYQKQALRMALEQDADGLYRYSTIIWSDIKKSAKSTIAAAVVLWRAFQLEWGSIYIIANDLKQADSRVAYYLRRAIMLNPELRKICTARNYKVTLPNHTFIEAIPIDPTGEAGSNADMVVFSELWGAHSKAQEQMWTETTLPPNKFGRSFRWVETYAGFRGASPLLERLYEQVVKDDQRLDDDLEVYESPNARMFALWNTRPRLLWQTDEYYASEAATLLPSEFDRVHRNQWSDGGVERFLETMLWWDACREDLPPLDPYEPLVLAADAGVSNDSFALVGVSRHPSRPNDVAVRLVLQWLPPKGGKLDFDVIEETITKLCEELNVVMLTYDPYQLHQMMTGLHNRGVVYTDEFGQQSERLSADKQLLDLIMRRGLAQDGNAILRQAIDNADRKVDPESRKIRIVKRTESLKIDPAVAASMAVFRCLEMNL